jgi:YHS domain-containing protein/thiol-disulfide isomerase/thioredoxin
MGDIRRLLWTAAAVLLLPLAASGEEWIDWQPTLESAKRLAGQTDRLVLIHFWADWCQVCMQMDHQVFGQPGVASMLRDNYVAVKINADHFPTTCRQYAITALPTDIIISPQGQPIAKLQGLLSAAEYAARLDQVVAIVRRPAGADVAQSVVAPPPTASIGGRSPQEAAGGQGPYVQHQPGQPYAGNFIPQEQPMGGSPGQRPQPVQPTNPQSVQAPSPQPPPGGLAGAGQGAQAPSEQVSAVNPPLGLDGYCPVQLIDDLQSNLNRWTLGDRRWGVTHRGRTYLFAGPQQRDRFWADPDRYAPVLSGNDVVIAVEQGRAVAGRREHGILVDGRIYLFVDEASLEKFSQAPESYVRQVVQAMQADAAQRVPLR